MKIIEDSSKPLFLFRETTDPVLHFKYRVSMLRSEYPQFLHIVLKEFEDTLTEEQQTAFRDLCDMQSSSVADEMRAAYKAGFKDGAKLIVEML